MGIVASRNMSAEKLQQIEIESGFSPYRIDYLLGQYQYLKRDTKDVVLKSELLQISQVAQHPFGDRLVDVYLYPSLGFQHFMLGLSRFRRSAPLQLKLESLLHMFDADGDGLLSGQQCEELINRLPATRQELRAMRWKLKQLMAGQAMEQTESEKHLLGCINCEDLAFITRNMDLDQSLSLRFSS